MRLAILGTGNVAQTLARRWSAAGHEITFGSRDPASKGTLDAPVTALAAAVAGSDVVVNATPGSASLELAEGIGAAAFAGKVLVDVANANTPSFELVYPNSSLAEKLQAALPGPSSTSAGSGPPADPSTTSSCSQPSCSRSARRASTSGSSPEASAPRHDRQPRDPLRSSALNDSPATSQHPAIPPDDPQRHLAVARPARPAQRLRPGIQLANAQRHRGLADPGGLGHRPDPAMSQRPGLGPHQQPPLPLIQMREDHLELRRQHLPGFLRSAHTTSMCQTLGCYGLFFCKL